MSIADDDAITITEAIDEGRSCFVITTESAIYYYDKLGGGFSSIVDSDGNDWLNFHMEPSAKKHGAAGKFRGLPNMVYRQDPRFDGAGHPGFDHCKSRAIGNKIITRSGWKWKWEWEFFQHKAVMTVTKIQKHKAYWFLYEGTPAGHYDIRRKNDLFWGNDLDGRLECSDTWEQKIMGKWKWAYFGHHSCQRVFYANMDDGEDHASQFYCMDADHDNTGMCVFGFGRSGIQPALQRLHRFSIGFIESSDHDQIAKLINGFAG